MTTALTPNAVTPSSFRTLRKPGPSPMSSRLPAAQPSPVLIPLMASAPPRSVARSAARVAGAAGIARHTRGRVAPRRHARRAARAAPPRPGPLRDPARRRRRPRADRRPARRRAHARDDPPAADRDRPRVPHRRLRVGPPRLRRAPHRRAGLDRLPRQPRLRDPAPRLGRTGGRPRAAGVDAPGPGLHARGLHRRAAPAARAAGGQGGDRRAALARRARRGGRRAGDPPGRGPRGVGRLQDALGPQGAGDPPARADRQGRGDRLPAARRRPRRGDLRRRRPHGPRRLPRPRGAGRHGPRADGDPGRCALGRGAAGARARGRRDGRRDERRAGAPAVARPPLMRFVDFLKATVLLCAGAATLLAALTIIGGARTREPGNTLIPVAWGGVAAGFAIIWALAWRRQDAAVTAIEERDGFRFYVDRTGIFSPIRLIRTRGLAAG